MVLFTMVPQWFHFMTVQRQSESSRNCGLKVTSNATIARLSSSSPTPSLPWQWGTHLPPGPPLKHSACLPQSPTPRMQGAHIPWAWCSAPKITRQGRCKALGEMEPALGDIFKIWEGRPRPGEATRVLSCWEPLLQTHLRHHREGRAGCLEAILLFIQMAMQ